MITQLKLKEILTYNSDNGLFFWNKKIGSKSDGSIAGYVNNKGYVMIGIENKMYSAHRLAWLYVYGVWPVNEIDHIDRCKTNNEIANLRDVTKLENLMNRKAKYRKSDIPSCINLVVLKSGEKKFVARKNLNGKKIHIGTFNNLHDAKKSLKIFEENHLVDSRH